TFGLAPLPWMANTSSLLVTSARASSSLSMTTMSWPSAARSLAISKPSLPAPTPIARKGTSPQAVIAWAFAVEPASPSREGRMRGSAGGGCARDTGAARALVQDPGGMGGGFAAWMGAIGYPVAVGGAVGKDGDIRGSEAEAHCLPRHGRVDRRHPDGNL